MFSVGTVAGMDSPEGRLRHLHHNDVRLADGSWRVGARSRRWHDDDLPAEYEACAGANEPARADRLETGRTFLCSVCDGTFDVSEVRDTGRPHPWDSGATVVELPSHERFVPWRDRARRRLTRIADVCAVSGDDLFDVLADTIGDTLDTTLESGCHQLARVLLNRHRDPISSAAIVALCDAVDTHTDRDNWCELYGKDDARTLASALRNLRELAGGANTTGPVDVEVLTETIVDVCAFDDAAADLLSVSAASGDPVVVLRAAGDMLRRRSLKAAVSATWKHLAEFVPHGSDVPVLEQWELLHPAVAAAVDTCRRQLPTVPE